MTEDIKGLLGRAFGPEPPLALDREEVLRRGRARVRARRIAAAGGVAASVVAVVVGAAALSGIGGAEPAEETLVGYGASTGRSVPTISEGARTGPSLPLTATPTDRHSEELTAVLLKAAVLPAGLKYRAVPGEAPAPPAFRPFQHGYRAAVDLVGPRGEGSLIIQVNKAITDSKANLCVESEPAGQCQERVVAGVPMAIRTFRSDEGRITYTAQSLWRDGTTVWVMSNNVSLLAREPAVTGPVPPLGIDVVVNIAALPGLSYY